MIRLSNLNRIQKIIRLNQYLTSSETKAPRCLVLHPVTFPNKGPIIEQYLAEEAIGLVSSLRWDVVRGPFWGKDKGPTDE